LKYAIVLDALTPVEALKAVFVHPHQIEKHYFYCPQTPMHQNAGFFCRPQYLVFPDGNDDYVKNHYESVL
jgi:hypothetical protein